MSRRDFDLENQKIVIVDNKTKYNFKTIKNIDQMQYNTNTDFEKLSVSKFILLKHRRLYLDPQLYLGMIFPNRFSYFSFFCLNIFLFLSLPATGIDT